MTGVPAPQRVWPGSADPRGAHWDGEGVNFAVYSRGAEEVELCLFDDAGHHEVQRIAVRERTGFVWHCYLPGARPGLAYGWRMAGPYRPEDGLRFNPHKLLIDPYARDFVGALRWDDALYGHTIGHPRGDLSFDRRDSGAFLPKCRVVDPAFSWTGDRAPATPLSDTVIYELHVRSFTMQHPAVPEALRGTYAALGSAPVIDYLKRLGITAVELMPVHSFIDERSLHQRQLRNHWGYNPLGFFAPERRYSASGKVDEFKTMVKSLHSAGIEVLLDVVYNHTCEGDETGPTLSLRGLDNATYYSLDPDNPRRCRDVTGCGNTVDLGSSAALQLVMDSLRYWVEDMHVDGFRFDLAPALMREAGVVEHSGTFLDAVRQDPILKRVKLIAEPWDLGPGGYQVGNFPTGWSEWNDRYRDGVRSYWNADGAGLGELASRLTGSSDLYARNGRRPQASINLVTAHDGFTLHDLVSYNDKHNEANGEDNRDGSNHNLSWNCGIEGPTDDPDIRVLRERQKRNLLATLLLSQGVPMLLAGDERGHTQRGNNNAYCQDNALSWLDWTPGGDSEALSAFTCRLIALRAAHPTFRRRLFFSGEAGASGVADLRWLRPDGCEMASGDWNDPQARCIAMVIAGGDIGSGGPHAEPIFDDDFLICFNAGRDRVSFTVPPQPGRRWQAVVDTRSPTGQAADREPVEAGSQLEIDARSVLVLRMRANRA